MISYEALIRAMKEKGVGKTELSRELGLSSRTVAKIAKGEKLSGRSMQKIADYLSLPAEILMREESSNRILQLLRDEKRMNLPGGLYHELQVRMTYNSNHMEGSKLSEDQTRYIFETSTVDVGDGIPVDDILETVYKQVMIPFFAGYISLLAPTVTVIIAIFNGALDVPKICVILNPLVFLIFGITCRKINPVKFQDLPGIIMPSLGLGMFGLIGMLNLM